MVVILHDNIHESNHSTEPSQESSMTVGSADFAIIPWRLLSTKSWIVRDSEEEKRGLFGFQHPGDDSDTSSEKKLLELFNDHGLWLNQVTVKR